MCTSPVGDDLPDVSYDLAMVPTIRAADANDVRAVLALWHEADALPTRTDDPVNLGRLIDHDPRITDCGRIG